jgi:hypothetical protein
MATTILSQDQDDVESVASSHKSKRRTAWRYTVIGVVAALLTLLGLALTSPSASAAVVTSKDSHVTFSVNMRNAPSVSAPIEGVIPAGAPVVIYCQLPTSDPYPTTVRGFGTSWLWDFVLARVNGVTQRGVITDLAPDNTPYQVRDPSLPDCRNLGGLDLAGYCPSMAGNTHVELRWPDRGAYGWACVSNNPLATAVWGVIPLTDVDYAHACTWMYGRQSDPGVFYAYFTDRSSPYTWRCGWRS